MLEKRIVKSGKGFKIALADKEVDYSPSFQLYLTTRLPNPHFTPELSAKVCAPEVEKCRFECAKAGLHTVWFAFMAAANEVLIYRSESQLINVARYRR